jgi:type II secretory pathway pseudopilin PulG
MGLKSTGGCAGTSLVETVIVLATICCVLGLGMPVLTNAADARRTRDAASFLAGQFRLARQRAVLTGRHVAIVFDEVSDEVGWRLCEDGDRDGLSRSDVASGRDRCDAPAQPLSFRFAQVGVGYVAGVPGPDYEVDPAPLRFGSAAMAVFTPTGTASAGTVAVRGPGLNQFAVRVSGVTGRTRLLRFDPGSREWAE